ncbi:MAG: arginine--tRNA ligase [Bacteroidales bacterium]|nr:arginine--tRNA ligase [Bacteroidales bacterium]
MDIEQLIAEKAAKAVKSLYNQSIDPASLQIEKTNSEFKGDFTLVVFPLLKISKKPPQLTAMEIGDFFIDNFPEVDSIEVVKGFLNLSLTKKFWLKFFIDNVQNDSFGFITVTSKKPFIVEYSSPNTNKPLHLGHVRNNLLGYSLSEILKANGKNVVKINLINDRGIHICKSMLAWQKWGEGETPEAAGLKGDHLIGKYYVLFDKKHKVEIEEMVHRGFTDNDAFSQAPIMLEAQEMLRKWENADEDILDIWRLMNSWVYDGFDQTYKRLGVDFDQTNYESSTYLQGKEIVEEGLEKELLNQKKDNSVWVDLTNEGLDEKILLRSDGTSVYITQDIGTAQRRWDEYHPEKLVYVVGNEQVYHFDVLKKVMKKLGRDWANIIHHLSYGMVELPEGRMKSREGKVVDADDLMDEMYNTAKKTTEALGKTEGFSKEELERLYNVVSLGALKYFILKVDPMKNMLFNPEESIDFNGNTGPFIQYTYARIQSIFRKAGKKPTEFLKDLNYNKIELLDIEKNILKFIYEFPQVVRQAGENYNPAQVANYCFELVKEYNHYYQDTPILKRVKPEIANFRVVLSWFTGRIIKKAVGLLGIEVPERM